MIPMFSRPHWAPFMLAPGLHSLSGTELVAIDSFLAWLSGGVPRQPCVDDYRAWAAVFDGVAPAAALAHLARGFDVLLPSEVAQVQAARKLCAPIDQTQQERPSVQATRWDPCAMGRPDRRRTVSASPADLPDEWKRALRQAAAGLPGHDAGAPSREILVRMREKICQLQWVCEREGQAVKLSVQAIAAYFSALEERLKARGRGVRWATMRASAEEIERFGRYAGLADEQARRHLRARLYRYARLEKSQDALKFAALFETGHTTISVLEKAAELLQAAAREPRPSSRHRLRSAAAILAVAAILGLRNASSRLVLGEDLRWEGRWVVDMEIVKTRGSNGERLVVPFRPEFGQFIDAAILGDMPCSMLPEIRATLCRVHRPLIVRSDGRTPHPGYVARIFKVHTGNTLTSTRTMLHTDQSVRRGEAGTRDTMQVLHQRSRRVAELYQGRAVRQAALQRVQERLADQQMARMDADQHAALTKLRRSIQQGEP